QLVYKAPEHGASRVRAEVQLGLHGQRRLAGAYLGAKAARLRLLVALESAGPRRGLEDAGEISADSRAQVGQRTEASAMELGRAGALRAAQIDMVAAGEPAHVGLNRRHRRVPGRERIEDLSLFGG